MALQIKLTSIFVADQARALRFYTEALGFVKRAEVALPNGDKWLTVAAPDGPNGPDGPGDVELLLEPNTHPAARAYQRAICEAGIPAAAFHADDVDAEHRRLVARGVVFRTAPVEVPGALIAVFDDTCGNLIQIVQPRPGGDKEAA